MVLSKKKLKQKLREALTESLAASFEAQNNPANNDSTSPDPNLQTLQSLKKPRFFKREKRRKTLPSQGPKSESENIENKSGGGDAETENREEVVIEKKERKKRKRDVGLEGESSELGENVAVEKTIQKKKKKKKKKKKMKSGENEGEKKGEKGANGGIEQLNFIEAMKISNGQESEETATKVYVGGIPYYSTEDDIRSYFESCGTITEVDCMTFPESGKFRGIAIISFKTEAATKRALALDGSDMGGLFLKILPYKATKAKKSANFTPSIMVGYNRIYVGNLSWDITEDELRKFFSGCNISSIRFGEDKETGEFRGYAHVDFADSLSLNMALKLDQEIVCGRPLRVCCAVPPKKNIARSNSKLTPVSEIIADNPSADVSSVSENVSGKIRRRTCYECGEKGHLSSSCPKKQAAEKTNGGGT